MRVFLKPLNCSIFHTRFANTINVIFYRTISYQMPHGNLHEFSHMIDMRHDKIATLTDVHQIY